MGRSVEVEAGRALRDVRLAQGLTLKQVGERSVGVFKPTAVAGYERAERSISLERFCALCALYDVSPERLLDKIMAVVGKNADVVVDLTSVEARDLTAV